MRYDAIVVGARAAGSPTAMLLARTGRKVLVVDKATFPSDTMSTHLIHPPGVAALQRWGLLDRLVATGVPPIDHYRFDFGPIVLSGQPRPVDGVRTAYGPRRTVLDALLVDAAREAGAEVREGFTLEEVVTDDGRVTGIRGHDRGGKTVTIEADLVVGADGRHSVVARAVEPETYMERPTAAATYYAYWSGVPVEGFEIYIRERRAWGALPTHDGLTCIPLSWPRDEFEANRSDVEGNYLKALEQAPAFAERVRAGKRESRFVGTGDAPGYLRKPFGPGWALVGDAGYHKDPCTAQGISDAFRDAELLVRAIETDDFPSYQRTRDETVTPLYELTCNLATMEPPPDEMLQLFGAAAGNKDAMDQWCSVIAGTLPLPEFLSEDNVGRIMSAAAKV